MGEWISNACATDVLKIPGKKKYLFKAIEDSQNKIHDVVKEDPLPNNNAMFEAEH